MGSAPAWPSRWSFHRCSLAYSDKDGDDADQDGTFRLNKVHQIISDNPGMFAIVGSVEEEKINTERETARKRKRQIR